MSNSCFSCAQPKVWPSMMTLANKWKRFVLRLFRLLLDSVANAMGLLYPTQQRYLPPIDDRILLESASTLSERIKSGKVLSSLLSVECHPSIEVRNQIIVEPLCALYLQRVLSIPTHALLVVTLERWLQSSTLGWRPSKTSLVSLFESHCDHCFPLNMFWISF